MSHKLAEDGLAIQPTLTAHRSSLPNSLYILSFAAPVPSPLRQPRKFITHPYVLYTIGTIAALLGGLGLPAFDITFGYWTNGIRHADSAPSAILARGEHAGLIMTLVGIAVVVLVTTFLTCCEW